MAQLFILDTLPQTSSIRLDDPGLCHQLTHVLRVQEGTTFFLQDFAGTQRYHVMVHSLHPRSILVDCIQTILPPSNKLPKTGIILAMPNKYDKLELIVQSLAQIGVDELLLWPSHRSLLRDLPPKKMARLQLIAREATEQAWGRTVPSLSFSTKFPTLQTGEVFLFAQHATGGLPTHSALDFIHTTKSQAIRGIVGPEGGFTEEEQSGWGLSLDAHISLGSQTLRMETASIVGGWWLKNSITKGV